MLLEEWLLTTLELNRSENKVDHWHWLVPVNLSKDLTKVIPEVRRRVVEHVESFV